MFQIQTYEKLQVPYNKDVFIRYLLSHTSNTPAMVNYLF